MAFYHFHVRDGFAGVHDTDGTELPDLEAARIHAHRVVRELLFGNAPQKRHYWLVVCDGAGQELFTFPFLLHDDSISHLSAENRRRIGQMCEKRLALAEAAHQSRMTMLRARASTARARSRPYLASDQGETIEPVFFRAGARCVR